MAEKKEEGSNFWEKARGLLPMLGGGEVRKQAEKMKSREKQLEEIMQEDERDPMTNNRQRGNATKRE